MLSGHVGLRKHWLSSSLLLISYDCAVVLLLHYYTFFYFTFSPMLYVSYVIAYVTFMGYGLLFCLK